LENSARVFDFVWRDDFSAARNFAAEMAVNDWIFVLDADEEVLGAEIEALNALLGDFACIGSLNRVELSDKSNSSESRLYHRGRYRYEGRIHEQIMPAGGDAKKVRSLPVLVAHYGYLPEFERVKVKLKRNEKLLLQELADRPDDPYLLFQLGKSYFCDQRDLQKACLCFEKSLSKDPSTLLGYVYDMVECYGYALINTGQYEKAMSLMEKYAGHFDGNPHFRFLSAHIFQNNGMFIEAVECYESCIGDEAVDYKGVTSHLSYYNIGVILECVGMTEDAVQMYRSCGEYSPAEKRLAELLG